MKTVLLLALITTNTFASNLITSSFHGDSISPSLKGEALESYIVETTRNAIDHILINCNGDIDLYDMELKHDWHANAQSKKQLKINIKANCISE